MKKLLNISTHPGEPEMFNDDWDKAGDFPAHWDFDDFELYPVGDYPCQRIPPAIIGGLHLCFFVILAPIWRDDRRRLLEIFGDWQTVEHFYGGRDAAWIVESYARQLELAQTLDAPYVVFHPVYLITRTSGNKRLPRRKTPCRRSCEAGEPVTWN